MAELKLQKHVLYNTALLTVSGLLMRCVALLFQIWLVSRIGSAGIGLFGLIMSVGLLASTFAISGIRFATTRLIAEEIGAGCAGGAPKATRRCMYYGLCFGLAAGTVLYIAAEPIGFLWIGDARTVLSLKMLAPGLPFLSLGAVIAGYFTAVGRVYKTVIVQISGQLVRIVVIALLLRHTDCQDLEMCCAHLTMGGTISDILEFILLSIFYLHDSRSLRGCPQGTRNLTCRMMQIAVPLAFSAYARTSLSTLEHLLVPRGLRSSGMSADHALSAYGIIQGMVFPIITFPSCILSALAELLVPELTAAQVQGDHTYIRDSILSMLRKCLGFSSAVGLFMFLFSDQLAQYIYHSEDAGMYIRLFSFIIPVIYMDIVTDGCLKGLGQMMRSMTYNILDAALGVLLVVALLPRFAILGYIMMIYVTEALNFGMSIRRLFHVLKYLTDTDLTSRVSSDKV